MVKIEPKSGIWRFSYEVMKRKPPVFWRLICWEALFDKTNYKTSFLKTFQRRQAKLFVAEIENLLTTGDVKPCPLCIKPLKVWFHFSSTGFYPGGTAAPDRLEHNPQNFVSHWSWLQKDSRGWLLEMGLQEANWAMCHWRRMSRSDLQELGLPEPCFLFSHPTLCRVISPQMMAGATMAVYRTGMMEDCNACESVEISHCFDPD